MHWVHGSLLKAHKGFYFYITSAMLHGSELGM